MKFIKRSLTGHYDYWQSASRTDGLAGRLYLIRCDYSPNQPRDSRGRFASGGGGGGGGGKSGGGGKKSGGGGGGLPLASRKVSDLQKMAEEAGIDVNTLSHKSRKSVLAAAIQAKRDGKDLREEGLLKPTKGGRKTTAKAETKKAEPKQSAAEKAAATAAKVHVVKKPDDFEDLIAHAFDKHKDDEGVAPIYAVRRELGDLVPRDKFNDWLIKMQRDDKVTLTSGSLTVRDHSIDKIADSVSTKISGIRAYMSFTDTEGAKVQERAAGKKTELNNLLKDRPELNPLGTASALAKGPKIANKTEFEKTALDAHNKLSYEFNHDNLVPIADVRKSLGDRVSPEEFNKYLLDLQYNDKVQLIGAEQVPSQLIDGGVKTRLGDVRVFMKKL